MGLSRVLVVEERFEYKGFPCVVMFNPLGFRTGYVGLPKGHKYYGKHYESIDIVCHGGLTYGRDSLYGQDDSDIWWIGFDCGHWGDGYDTESLEKYYGNTFVDRVMDDYRKLMNEEFEFRTVDYVKAECMAIVDQLCLEV